MFLYYRCLRRFLLACALASAARLAVAQSVVADLYITEEDLQEALERGDLSFEEYEQLLDLFRSRATSDSQQLDASRVPGESPLDFPVASVVAREDAPFAFYQATVPLRGDASENQILGIEPHLGRISLRWEIARGTGDWYVRTARATLDYGDSRLTLGAFDTRWTGGLLIGSAPAFMKAPGDFVASITQPKRGRLNGAQYEWRSGNKTVAALLSERHDTVLVHQSYGVKLSNKYGGAALEACYLHQALQRRRLPNHFGSDLIGIAASSRWREVNARADLASNTRNVAFQGSIGARHRFSYDWQLSMWQIPGGFRHPLLATIGEPDREMVWYPELELSISSPSTGERGVDSRLSFGPRERTNSVEFTYWREGTSRPASLRGKFARHQSWQAWAMEGEYFLHTRSVDGRRSYRHELSGRLERATFFAMAKLRFVDGEWSPFGARGVRAQVGWRAKVSGGAVGEMTTSLAYDDFDLSKNHSAFWKLRVDQELPVRGRGKLGVHIRWRTRHTQTPPSLTLRVAATMYL